MSNNYRIEMLEQQIRDKEKRRDELVAQTERTLKRNQYNKRKARAHRLYQVGAIAERIFGDRIIGKDMLDIEIYFQFLKDGDISRY